MKLSDLTRQILLWINSVAPGRKPQDTVCKMVSETSELLDAVMNKGDAEVKGELADCMICLLDLADAYNVDIIKAAFEKLEINRQRKWEMKDGVLRRIRNEHSD